MRRKHRDLVEVKAALKLPKAEQNTAFAMLKRRGIFEDNKERIRTNNTNLIRERRRGKSKLAICSHCNGFFSVKTIWKHKRNCTDSSTPSTVTVQSLQNACPGGITAEFKTNVVDHLRDDDIGNVCREDELILHLGKKLWNRNIKRERKPILAGMRRMGRLLLTFREVAGREDLQGKDLFDSSLFETLEEALVIITSKEDDVNDVKNGLKLNLGYLLKKAANVQKAIYCMTKRMDEAASIDNFLCVLDLNWESLFFRSQVAVASKRQETLRRPQALPREQDVSTMKDHILSDIHDLTENSYLYFSNSEYVKLRTLLVTRLTLFNARRGGEPARLLLTEWEDALNDAWINPSFLADPKEQQLVEKCKIAYQASKNAAKLVSVHIPEDCIKAIKKLVEERENVGIVRDNPYLFALTQGSHGHAQGWQSVHDIAVNANLERPDLITATKFRHRASTLFAAQDLPPEKREAFYKHMGHTASTNENIYQCPLAVKQLTSVTPFLRAIDGSAFVKG